MGDAMIRELLLGDDVAGQVELLLNLLSDAAAGRELSNVVSEVIQVTIAGGVGQKQVKQLAYDLCKAVPLLSSDYSLLVDGIKNDISCGVPEAQVLALSYLPHLPPEHLLHLLDKGDIANFVEPHTRSTLPAVRCAATSALCAVLLVPEVQAALAASPDLSTSGSDWWDSVVDSVGDSMPDVLVAGLAATNALFEAAAAGSSAAGAAGSSTGCVVAAQRAALRLAAGIGPLMDTWRMLHTHAQVPVIQLLGHMWGHLLAADAAASASAAATAGGRISGSGGGSAYDVPESSSGSIAAALPGILAYLSNALSSLNPAVKLEAARVLLRVSKASSSSSSVAGGDGLLSRMRLVGSVPPATAAAAIEALLELKGRLLVEAALEEVVSLVAAHLDLLQVPTRLAVLQRLWPMIALLQSPTDRLTAFAHSWRAALELSISSSNGSSGSAGQPEGAAATLSAILSDPFLADVISERPAAAAAAAALAAKSSSGGGAPPDAAAAAAAAGPTGGSTVSSAAGGGMSAADMLGVGGAAAGPTGGSDRERIVLSGSFSGSSSSRKKLMMSASKMISSGATLASNMGGALASAATTGLAAIPLPKWMDSPAPARAQLPATLKQELVCTLLEVLQQHPAADAALKLPLGKPVPQPAPGASTAAAAAAAAAASASQNGQTQQQQDVAAAAAAAEEAPVSPASTADGNPAAAAAAAMAAAAATPASSSSATPAVALPATPAPAASTIRPQFGPEDVSVSPVVASLQAQVVTWLGAAVTALQHTRACLHWEPLVPPPMPGNPPAPPLPPLASVNLTTVPVDLWLQLLQAACQAVRGVVRLHGYDSLKAIYRANGGRMLPQLSPWDASGAQARTAESSAAALQQLLTRGLSEWRGLALAVRPRVLWVAAHYLELPAMLDETWGVLLSCVEDALLRAGKAEGDARARQLAASARDGLLLKKFAMPQLSNLGRDKSGAQTTFDAAAASALVEMPEYRSDGLQVGLTVLQYLAWVVQASIAASTAAAVPGPGSSNAANGAAAAGAGPAEGVLARKLLELVKAVGAQEGAGVDVRDWCKRMARMLSTAADPAAAASSGVAAAHAGGPAFAMAPPPPSSGPGAAKAALPSGYNAVAGFSALGYGGGDSSDDEDDGPAGLSREERLKRRLGLSGAGGSGRKKAGLNRRTADSSSDEDGAASSSSSSGNESSSSSGSSGSDAAAGGSSDSDTGGPALHNPLSGLQLAGQTNADGQTESNSVSLTGGGLAGKDRRAQRRAAKAAKKAREARAAAAMVAVGAPDAASGVWGYPFGGPRSATLFISRRSRRHRLFKWQLAMAMANVAEEDSRAAGAAGGAVGAAAAAGGGGGSLTGSSSGSSRRNAQLGGLFGAGSGASGFSGLSGSAAGSVGTTMASAGLTDATGPVFSAESGFRLDQAGFWDSLPGGASGWQELTGPNDPLVLAGRYSAASGAGSAAGEITVVLRAFNRLPVDLEGVEVAVRLVGPARAERREASWMLPRLLPTEAAQHSFKLMPTGYGRLEVHARVLLPVPQLASDAAAAPALACQPLVVSMAQLLSPPACPPASAQDMLALWASLPVQVELSGTAVWPGLDGLLLLLSALARQPLHCAWAHMLPVVCGAQAAFVACPTAHSADTLAMMVVAQLMPDAAANAAAADAAAAAQDEAEQQGAGASSVAGDADGAQKQQATGQQQQQLRGVVQLVVRASSHEVLLAIQQEPDAWVNNISQGTLALGVASGQPPPRPSRGKTLLHPCIARLAQQLAAAGAVMPPPAPVPALTLPPLPTFGKKLRAKADEEDSDAEDEELPPTADEAAAQQQAMEKHAADCDKAREAHAAAKASRAASVLRRAALAEWRRAACPSMA